MKILCLDTSAVVSAAIVEIPDSGDEQCSRGASTVLSSVTHLEPRKHAELLTGMIDRVLQESDTSREGIGAVLVGTGPGPFTGLRVGIVSGRTVGFALQVPVWGLPSHYAIAAAVMSEEPSLRDVEEGFLVTTDARRKELYGSQFTVDSSGVLHNTWGPVVQKSESFAQHFLHGLPRVYGFGATLYPEVLGEPASQRQECLYPQADWLGMAAGALLAAGRSDLLAATEPLYLRQADAVEPGKPKSALG